MTFGGQAPMRIGVVGDIVPGRNVHLHMLEYGDFTRPFLRVAPLLRSFDVTVANLEGNLSDTLPGLQTHIRSPSCRARQCSKVSSWPASMQSRSQTTTPSGTAKAGGCRGSSTPSRPWMAHGLPYFGAGTDIARARQPWVVEVGGNTSIAFLGIDGVTANHEVAPSPEAGVLDFDAAGREKTTLVRTPISSHN